MRIGIFVEDLGRTVDEYFTEVAAARAAGLKAVWLAERFSWDPLTLLAMTSREFPDLTVGASIVRTYAHHPLALAAQALTVGNRLVLGVGPSHRPIIENQYGYSFDKPVRHVREYLTALRPLLRGESVDYQGETLKASGKLVAEGSQPPPLLLSALGPQMLGLAAELADGTITTWAGPKSISDYFVPTLRKAGPGTQVVASITVSVTSDPAAAREKLEQTYGMARNLPSYQVVLEREGVGTIGETLVAGDEDEVARQILRHRDAGATEIIAIPIGTAEEQRRTVTLLGSVLT